MGRKNKGKQQFGSGSSQSNKLLSEKVDHLLQICSAPNIPSGSKLWEDHLEIDKTVAEIRSIQADSRAKTDRGENFSSFMDWLRSHGVNLDKVSVGHFDSEGGGWGVRAVQPIKESELWLSVPRALMMTLDTARDSAIGDFLARDKIAKCLSQVALSLHLLDQRLDMKSFWKPYLDVLPCDYETVLYFSTDELQLLKGSHCFEESLMQFRNIARQYAYFWKTLNEKNETKTRQLKEHFTFDNYRWAVSTVMTRQNAIPDTDGSHKITALIPFWDMCNHQMGTLSTDFDLEKNTLECYALHEFQPEEQVFIFYGPRSNSEFFLHNAFVVRDNYNDAVKIRLGISKDDVMCGKKCYLLERIHISGTDTFAVTCESQPISRRLWAFSQIFSMTGEELDTWLSMEDADLQDLFTFDVSHVTNLNPDLHKRAQNFLLVRLSLLLRAYPTTVEEDESILKEGTENIKKHMAVSLRISEKKILIAAIEFLKMKLNEKNS